MAIFVSDYLGFNEELAELGVFDSIIDEDSNFFINLIRLKTTQVPEFQKSYERINDLFSSIATLLDISDKKEDKFYNTALKQFNFSEVNGINLGYSESRYGSGFGPLLRKQVIDDAFDIVKKGSKQPEIFQLVGLFEENIGPDRLSDMVATIILPDIVNYTKRINKELRITPELNPDLSFNDDLVLNPYKNCEILLLPIDILQELPIAKCWDDIDRVIQENESIRQEINEAVSEEWYKWASGQKKQYLKEQIFKNPERCARVIDGYRRSTVPPIKLSSDLDYFVAALFRQMKKSNISFQAIEPEVKTSLRAAEDILNIFKDWVENNRGWNTIQETESTRREKVVQRLFHLGAKHYIQANNLDISFEPDAGRGPADFKVSRGGDITVGEIKLSSNSQYLHGYTVQIEEYAIAEGTRQRVFVLVDTGNPGRLKKITTEHQNRISSGEDVPILFIVDSTSKTAASTYN
ncbi:MAG TPA: hypothetical protein PK675_00620 [Clostridia bacterium]|nr:hypothetical protein [Clostridia bacterium]